MDPRTGQLYDSVEEARAAGVKEPVELYGEPAAIARISGAVAALAAAERKRKRRAAKKARRVNRA